MEIARYKILLIGNDEVDESAFKCLIDNEGLPYDCVAATSVGQARTLLESESFDVAISDYLLSDGTAFDVLNVAGRIPVVIITAAGNEEVAVNALKAGARDYLIKDPEILNQKQKSLQAIFDAAPVGMLLVDESMIVRRVNRFISQMLRRKYSEIINRRVGDVLGCVNIRGDKKGCGYGSSCPSCPLRSTIEVVLYSGQSAHEVEIKPRFRVEGKEVRPWLSVSVEPVIIDGFKRVVVAIDDITGRKQAEEKLRETMELRSQFVATVSHELRTPLTCMKEAIAVLLDGAAGRTSKKQKNFLEIATRNIDRLTNLINNVLDFQDLEANRAVLHIDGADIKAVVEDLYKTMAPLAEKENLSFAIEFADALPGVTFDTDKIVQVLTNLVSNAIKFTPAQGSICLSVQSEGRGLVISLSDTGMGIPKESLPRIFDRFYRVQEAGRQIQGTGLGLTIVKKIVNMHGGRIEVESEVRKGSTFKVFLPLDARRAVDVTRPQADAAVESTLVGD
jgi:signal transduction histidine kinase/CheY-like chemotaxis protein